MSFSKSTESCSVIVSEEESIRHHGGVLEALFIEKVVNVFDISIRLNDI